MTPKKSKPLLRAPLRKLPKAISATGARCSTALNMFLACMIAISYLNVVAHGDDDLDVQGFGHNDSVLLPYLRQHVPYPTPPLPNSIPEESQLVNSDLSHLGLQPWNPGQGYRPDGVLYRPFLGLVDAQRILRAFYDTAVEDDVHLADLVNTTEGQWKAAVYNGPAINPSMMSCFLNASFSELSKGVSLSDGDLSSTHLGRALTTWLGEVLLRSGHMFVRSSPWVDTNKTMGIAEALNYAERIQLFNNAPFQCNATVRSAPMRAASRVLDQIEKGADPFGWHPIGFPMQAIGDIMTLEMVTLPAFVQARKRECRRATSSSRASRRRQARNLCSQSTAALRAKLGQIEGLAQHYKGWLGAEVRKAVERTILAAGLTTEAVSEGVCIEEVHLQVVGFRAEVQGKFDLLVQPNKRTKVGEIKHICVSDTRCPKREPECTTELNSRSTAYKEWFAERLNVTFHHLLNPLTQTLKNVSAIAAEWRQQLSE